MGLTRQKVTLFSRQYREVKQLYQTAFPKVERLPYLPLILNTYRPLADCYAYYDGDSFVGLAYLLQNDDLLYLFFLAVNTKIRSRGYGSAILQDIKKVAGNRPIILAIEPLDESADNYAQRQKRVAFYAKNGFQLTAYYYHEGKEIYQVMATDPSLDIHKADSLTKQALLGFIKTSFNLT